MRQPGTNFASVIATFLVVCATACGGGLTGMRISEVGGELRAELRDSGAIIVDGRQLATVDKKGKVVTSHGKMIGWVYDDSIRLSGGTTLPIRTNTKGEIYVPEDAQSEAGLDPVKAHVRPDGTFSKGVFQLAGASGARDHRIALFLLLILENPKLR